MDLMKTAQRYRLIMVTMPDLKSARKLVTLALQARLVACGNVIPRLESHYWWQGKIETSAEVMILFKSTGGRLAQLEKLIQAHHPYDTPEIIVLRLNEGTPRYLKWIDQSLARSG
jgi:periplasmic divalent cation tolerance protein